MTSGHVESVLRSCSQQNVVCPLYTSPLAAGAIHTQSSCLGHSSWKEGRKEGKTLGLPNYMVLYYSKGFLNLYSNK